jgi:ABC-type polysaccharide/polyol phosphate export permease
MAAETINEFLQHKDLFFMLAWRDIKIRYKQSVMGFLWAILMPILIVGAGLVVSLAFSTMSGRSVDPNGVLSVIVKAVPWAFFVGAIRFSTNSLVGNKELVTKIYFPREILPLASVLASLFDLAVATVLVALVLAVMKVGTSIHLLWLPVPLLLLILLTSSLSLLLSCANLFLRDVKYLVEVALTYGIFFTPVFYSASTMGKFAFLVRLNPVSGILESITDVIVVKRAPDAFWLCYSALSTLFCLVVAVKIFRQVEPAFAEKI